MKKRLLGTLLSVAMVASLLVGCGSKTEESAAPAEESTVAETAAPAEVEDVETNTVYVSAAWVDAAMKGEVEGYEDVVVAEVGDVGSVG